MYVIHFLVVAAIFTGTLPLPSVDRVGVVVLFHGAACGRGRA